MCWRHNWQFYSFTKLKQNLKLRQTTWESHLHKMNVTLLFFTLLRLIFLISVDKWNLAFGNDFNTTLANCDKYCVNLSLNYKMKVVIVIREQYPPNAFKYIVSPSYNSFGPNKDRMLFQVVYKNYHFHKRMRYTLSTFYVHMELNRLHVIFKFSSHFMS